MAKKNQKQKRTRAARKSRAIMRPAAFGPVSQINTAPVSVGNSVRGSAPRVRQTTDGARVVGRDFAFSLSATGSAVTGWELIGMMPITPCVLPSSVLRNYCQMFQKFKVNSVVVHYITSSPTSQAGDVLFYYERDALAPMCDYSNSSFLPYVLSDPHTIIGPQWTNHSCSIIPTKEWKSTLYGNQTDLNEDKAGSIAFFSKTNAANSPGYLLIDYDISFKELSVNPRAGTLPVARGQSQFVCFNKTATAVTANTTAIQFAAGDVAVGKTIANVTSAQPTGLVAGDIYKAVLQVTASQQVNAAWTNITTSNFLVYADNATQTIDDGFTLYMLWDGTNWNLIPSLEAGVTATRGMKFGVTATVTFNLCAELHLVRNVDTLTQSAY